MSSNLRQASRVRGSIQVFMHRAAHFWRGSTVIAAVVCGALVVVAFAIPEVYESEAIIELQRAPAAPDNAGMMVEPSDRLLGVLLDPRLVEVVTRDLTPAGAGHDLGGEALDRTRQSIAVRTRSETSFAVVFRAASAHSAQRGCARLSRTAVQQLNATQDHGAKLDAKLLEDRTRDLASFVAEHPEVALRPAEPSASSSAAAKPSGPSSSNLSDSALVVLQQQRAKLEVRLAEAERSPKSDSDDNPYEEKDDPAALRQMLAQVKAAITARQNAAARSRAEPASSAKPSASPPASSGAPALQAEWQRLVQAVLEAQKESSKPVVPAPAPEARLAAEATLPSRPIKPNRPVLVLVGLSSGLWMGVLWAFARVALGHDPLAPESRRESRRPPPPAMIEGDAGLVQPSSADARQQELWRAPMNHHSTQPGVVDVNEVLAQTGNSAASVRPAVVPAPIVDVGPAPVSARSNTSSDPSPKDRPASDPPPVLRRQRPLPNAKTLVGHFGPQDPSLDPGPPRSDPPARPSSDPAPRSSSDPPAQHRSDPPASDPPRRPRSDPPAQHRSEPPRVQHAGSRSDPPLRTNSEPPPVTAKNPHTDPGRPLMARSEFPKDVIAFRDPPSGWKPASAVAAPSSLEELRAVRDQLYRFAVRGCFVVGVTSTPDVTSKSETAAQLAWILAEGRARVLLMEADFDQPAIHRALGVETPLQAGLSEQLRRRNKGAARVPWLLIRCSPTLHVLAEGRVRSPGLLSAVQFVDALSDLRGYYDVIVLDGPVAGESVDAQVLEDICDGLVVVGPSRAQLPHLQRQAAEWFTKKKWTATLAKG